MARRELAVSIPEGEPTRLVSLPVSIGRGSVLAGKYQVERVLGVGGMGVVVSARHLQLAQKVALKFLLPEVAKDAETVERFLREAQAASRIRNEHVARVIDVGTLPEVGAPYMVMELLEGRDLAGVLADRGGPLPAVQAVDYILQGMEAIAEAHAIGIVHRDLKPANLFLTHRADGSPLVKVLDFGLSKEVTLQKGQRALTKTSTSGMGSPLYMAPEQVRSAKTVSYPADVWSLGVTLYELLTNETPFHGEGIGALLASVVADEPRSLRAIRPDVPEQLEAVIMKCLVKDPAGRHPDLGAMAVALAPFASPAGRASCERVVGAIARAGSDLGTDPNLRAVTAPGAKVRSLWNFSSSPRTGGARSSAVAVLGLIALGAAVGIGSFLALRSGQRPAADVAASSDAESTSQPPSDATPSSSTSTPPPASATSASADPPPAASASAAPEASAGPAADPTAAPSASTSAAAPPRGRARPRPPRSGGKTPPKPSIDDLLKQGRH